MLNSSWKSFVLTEAWTHGPGCSTPMLKAECYTTQLSRHPQAKFWFNLVQDAALKIVFLKYQQWLYSLRETPIESPPIANDVRETFWLYGGLDHSTFWQWGLSGHILFMLKILALNNLCSGQRSPLHKPVVSGSNPAGANSFQRCHSTRLLLPSLIIK